MRDDGAVTIKREDKGKKGHSISTTIKHFHGPSVRQTKPSAREASRYQQ